MHTIEDVPGGTRVHAENGDINIYTININGGWMSKWSAVQTGNPQNYGNSRDGSWGNQIGQGYPGRVYPAEIGIVWNVSIPDLPPLTPFYSTLIMEDRIIGTNTGNIFGGPQPEPEFWAISLEPGHEGELMWRKEWTPPVADLWVHFTPNWLPSIEDGVFLIQAKETGENWGFDIDSGNELWGPTDRLPDIATATNLYFPRWGQAVGADGIVVLGGGMGGSIRGHDVRTGVELWRVDFVDEHQETLFGPYWPMTPQFVTDGKVYIAHQEHSPLDPKGRDAPFVALDLETGEVVFEAEGMFRSTRWGGQHIIGDSIMAAMDTYDQRVYAVGKGPSQLTVEKPQAIAELGSAMTIHGTIMDVSPGTEDIAIRMRFPNGVPAVSDADQSEWMKYLYKETNIPIMTTGVDVALEAVTPSGNYQQLGRTTSDSYGNWAFGWCPEEVGTYMIIATFEGSGAYYPSAQTSYLTVADPIMPADVDLTSIEDGQASIEASVSNLTTYILIILVLVIIALIVAIYCLLKKQ
jgi:outer membrane protein assembly factor BamB